MKATPTEISALMEQIKLQQRHNVADTVMLNCVLGAATAYVNTDSTTLHQILSSLVENAAKHTDKGSITFGYDVNDDELYFYVKDTGSGIPRDLQDEIFDPDSPNADSTLIACMADVESLGGEIGVESRGLGKGATLWFTIPNTPADAPDSVPQTAEPSSIAIQQQPSYDFSHQHTILIAEDIDSNYMLFKSILESKYNLIHALNGQQAIDLFSKYKVDIILMDISMPIMDGYEATRNIRKISTSVPIVAVTAYAFTTDKQRIYENGFNGYVSMPISIKRLQRVIDELLSR